MSGFWDISLKKESPRILYGLFLTYTNPGPKSLKIVVPTLLGNPERRWGLKWKRQERWGPGVGIKNLP